MISTVVVSYKRPDLLKLTLQSYLETVTGPYKLLVVDNGSCEEALEVAADLGVGIIALGENRFPGYSTNVGWDALRGDHLLHRSDNDVEYLPGWCDQVYRAFEIIPNLGQLGLRTIEEEGSHPNVGGNCVVRAEVFAKVRWSEEPWQPNTKGEDYFFTRAVDDAGYVWGRVAAPCIIHRGAEWPERPTDPYYAESWGARGHW